eukprot:gene34317-41532_t
MSKERGSLLICQKNSYLRESFNQLLSCEKNVDNNNYRVVLDDSALYPEGGGQPCDLGTVDGVAVVNVLKAEGTDGVVLEVAQPLTVPVGGQVKCVVDWNRRFDFMQQHTAQHLISAVAFKQFGADTVGWSLGEEVVTVDLSPPPTSAQLIQLEEEVNGHIRSNLRVSYELLGRDEIDRDEALRGTVKGAARDLSELRVVVIEGLDKNPCGGTHVSSLGELNLIKLLSLSADKDADKDKTKDKTKDKEKAKDQRPQAMRLRFVAGSRALQHYAQCVQREAALSSLLSVPAAEHVTALQRLLQERREAAKKMETYALELATFWGQSLASSLPAGPGLIVQYRASADLKFLLKAATQASETRADALVFLASHDPGSSNAGPFVLFGDVKRVEKCKTALFELLGARGGGKPGRVQGYAQSLQKELDGVRKVLEEN